MVEANSVIPLYKQIVRALSDSIANGTYRPGDKLPTEAELIEQFGVSRITVRSAIKEMEDAGLVERARGKGTFVSSDTQMYAADDRESFTHSCQLAGKQASTRVLEMGWDFPSLRDAKFLGVDDTQKVLRSVVCALWMASPRCWKPIAILLRFLFWSMSPSMIR